jgi:G3E family GTPase
VSTLERHPEAVRQVAVADRVLVTKTDVSSLSQIAELEQRVRLHNGHAHLHRVAPGRVDASWITHNGLYDVATKSADVNRWLLHELHRTTPSRTIGALAPPPSSGILAGVDFGPALQAAKILSTPWSQSLRGETLEPRHGEVRTASLVITDPINPASFEEWLTLLVGLRGEDFLRTKGILNVQGVSGPVVIHGVQDVFHPPVTLDAWPSDDHRSRLVFITRGISVERLQETLSLFLAASKAPVAA